MELEERGGGGEVDLKEGSQWKGKSWKSENEDEWSKKGKHKKGSRVLLETVVRYLFPIEALKSKIFAISGYSSSPDQFFKLIPFIFICNNLSPLFTFFSNISHPLP